MFGIGLPEMLIILAVALIVVGPDKLPELARSLARGLTELKKTAETVKKELAAENPLPDLNDLKAGLPNLADLKSDLLPDLPNLREAAKRFEEDILKAQAGTVKALPEKTGETDAPANTTAADGNAIAVADAATNTAQPGEPDTLDYYVPPHTPINAEENVQPPHDQPDAQS